MSRSMIHTAATGLRILWFALMAILLVLLLTSTISGYATAAYSAVVLLVLGAELLLRHKLRVS